MHSATRVRTFRVARLYSVLYSEIALSRKPFGIGHMYIYTFFAKNNRYYDLPQNLPFLLGHCVYTTVGNCYDV
jgi:hypothetical protein